MTPTQPGQPGKKLSKGQRAAAAAALIAVTGLTGWATAAGSLAPASEPMSRTMQANRPAGEPTDTAGSVPPGSTSSGSASPDSVGLTPQRSDQQAPAGETPAPGGPAAPGAEGMAPPAASGKIINEPPPVAPPKGFDKPAEVAQGVTTRVRTMRAVNGVARGPGEVGGPAIQFTFEVTNSTTEPISLAEAVVNVEAGADRFPAEELSGSGSVPFPAEVAPGQKVSGVFVFQIPPEQRKTVRVLFHYEAVSPVAAFEGTAPVQGEAP